MMFFLFEKKSVNKKKIKKSCGCRDSNTIPPDLQSDALPGELQPQLYLMFVII